MTRPLAWMLLLTALLLGGCVSPPERRPDAVLQGQRFLELGVHAYRNDDYANAAAHFTKALAHYQGLDDRVGILRSRINLAETAIAIGNYDAAVRHLDVATELAQADHRTDALRRIALLRSTLALKRGEYDAAVVALQPLMEGDDAIARNALANRVSVALARHDTDVLQWVDRFARVVRQDDVLLTAKLLRFRAELQLDAGDFAASDKLLEEALAHYKSIPNRTGIAATLEQWGELLMQQRQWDAAEDKLQRALDVRLWLLDRADSAADLRRLAAINGSAGRSEKAEALRRWADIVGGEGPVNWSALKREVLPF